MSVWLLVSWGCRGILNEVYAPPTRERTAFRKKNVETPSEIGAAANGSEPVRLISARRKERGHYSHGLENKLDRADPIDAERNLGGESGLSK